MKTKRTKHTPITRSKNPLEKNATAISAALDNATINTEAAPESQHPNTLDGSVDNRHLLVKPAFDPSQFLLRRKHRMDISPLLETCTIDFVVLLNHIFIFVTSNNLSNGTLKSPPESIHITTEYWIIDGQTYPTQSDMLRLVMESAQASPACSVNHDKLLKLLKALTIIDRFRIRLEQKPNHPSKDKYQENLLSLVCMIDFANKKFARLWRDKHHVYSAQISTKKKLGTPSQTHLNSGDRSVEVVRTKQASKKTNK